MTDSQGGPAPAGAAVAAGGAVATGDAAVAAAVAGDESAFTVLVGRYRRELHVHCYRMLGSFEDAEDLVQETFLRAWQKRATYQGRASFRAWLYRIATNACLDFLDGRPRRLLPPQVTSPASPQAALVPRPDIPWLQPYPDRLLDRVAPSDTEPDAAVVAKETIELAFLATIQLLPPRQRAVLIARDVLGWSARQTAALLDTSVVSVNSALQRARCTLKAHLPARRMDWAPHTDPSEQERALLQRYMSAHERADAAAVAALMREDGRLMMPPYPTWWQGPEAIRAALAPGFDPASPRFVGDLKLVPTRANRQLAAANYVRYPGQSVYRPLGLDVLRVQDGLIAEIVGFAPDLFPAFGLPATL